MHYTARKYKLRMNQTNYNIVQLFLEAAQKYPKNIAIIEGEDQISYQNLVTDVRQTAMYFTDKGIVKGDRVLVFVPMSIKLYRIVLALFHIGATAVFLDEWVSRERLLLCCRLANCKGFIGTNKARLLGLMAKEIRQIPIKLGLNKKHNIESQGIEVHPDTSALITYTTGSTGTPKAADRSHGFLLEQFKILKTKLGSKPSDVDMTMMPIVLFLNLGVGATSIIANFNSRKPELIQPKLIFNQLKFHHVNRLTASPFVVKCLSDYLINNREQLHSLRQVFTGGAPVFPREGKRYLEAFPTSELNIIYGSTEAEPISSINAKALVNQAETLKIGLPVGAVHQATELKIISLEWSKHSCNIDEFNNHDHKEHEIGEIIVAGDHVLKRYYNNPEAFKENKIVVGNKIWHRTGDSGFIKDGQLFLTGRCQQLVLRNNQILSPFILENQIQDIEGVSAGTLLEHEGNLVLALETDQSEDQLKPRLTNQIYDRLVLTSSLPRDPRHHSKLDYGRIRTIL